MFHKIITGFAAAAAFVFLTGFGAGAPVLNVISASIPPHPAANMENIEKAVIRAGLTLGWQMVPKGPGRVEGVLTIRKHQAIIEVTFDARSYNINYKDSVNLDYRPNDRTIHSNYNGWIQNLDKAIRAQVTVL
ncbi:MAG: hypothetical protein H7Y16_00975 [Candidatus Parcubacteria bacterium]|nr:hypothetical protein [Burkholderiales bacterium]